MKRITRNLLTRVLIISLCIVSLYNANLSNAVFAEDSYGIIADKNPGVFYGEQLKNSEYEHSYNVYEYLKNIDINTTELIYEFSEPIKLEGKKSEELSVLNFEIIKKLNATVQIAMDAFIKDFPEIFWFDYGKCLFKQIFSSSYDEAGNIQWYITKLEISFTRDAAFTGETKDLCKAVYDKAYEIIASVGTDSVYERVKTYHDYLCKNITYIIDCDYPRNIYGGLIDGQGVCEAYAESFKFLCDLSNIPCISVMGKAGLTENKENHLWNYLYMDDGKWYAVDVTWDDQPNLKPNIIYDHFLCGSDNIGQKTKLSFSDSHSIIGDFSLTGIFEFTYPEISTDKYEYVPGMTPVPTATVMPTVTATITPMITETPVPTETPVTTELPICTVTPTATETPSPTVTETPTDMVTITPVVTEKMEYVLGDINEDGKINAQDALLVLKHAAKIEVLAFEKQLLSADVNVDGNINATDALDILKRASGIINEF